MSDGALLAATAAYSIVLGLVLTAFGAPDWFYPVALGASVAVYLLGLFLHGWVRHIWREIEEAVFLAFADIWDGR